MLGFFARNPGATLSDVSGSPNTLQGTGLVATARIDVTLTNEEDGVAGVGLNWLVGA